MPIEPKFFLDEGVPRSVGRVLAAAGFDVIYFQDAAVKGSPDSLIAEIANRNCAVLVAIDKDMRQMAKKREVSNSRFRRLSLLKIACRETEAAERVEKLVPYIKLHLEICDEKADRHFWFEIHPNAVKIFD